MYAFGIQGMRIGSLQRFAEHVHLDADIPYYDLVYQENRGLKNKASIRQVPIHAKALPMPNACIFQNQALDKVGVKILRRTLSPSKLWVMEHTQWYSFVTRMRQRNLTCMSIS